MSLFYYSFGRNSLFSRRTTCPLVRLVKGKERWEAFDHPYGVLHKIGEEPRRNVLSPVWCSKLRLTTGVYLALCSDKFRAPRSVIVRQVALVTTTEGYLTRWLLMALIFPDFNLMTKTKSNVIPSSF
ncbi:hypothetical protein TNCV_3001881 [Trichonephila clavipes]|nr:hypothetical protein TNCV_3001881 [Trichonephila clavipes]